MMNRIIIHTEDLRGRLSKEMYSLSDALDLIKELTGNLKNNDIFFAAVEVDEEESIDDFYLYATDILRANAIKHDSEVGEHSDI